MKLWQIWFSIVNTLKPACARKKTFFWMLVFLMAMSTRCGDLAGVTSAIRVLGLLPNCYCRILDFLHSPSLNITILIKLWVRWALNNFIKKVMVNEKIVLLADGIKVAKEGKKMPAVKSLHQESESNSKAEFIMGHSCQAVGLLVSALGTFMCVPLICQIHEGVIFSNRNKRTLYDKLITMLDDLGIEFHYYLIADAYYSVGKVISGIKKNGNHLITRAKKNIVAFEPAQESVCKKAGRPKKYGEKVKLANLLKKTELFKKVNSPIYGEKNTILSIYSVNLLWRASGEMIQFVLVKHPNRGSIILVSTDLTLDPLKIIELYGLRFKIEVTFKQSLHTIGAFSYHFWLKIMKPIKRGDGDQYLHRETPEYKNAIKRKIETYHRVIQLGFIAQGILQYLSISMTSIVWKNFGSWIRTIRSGIPPSEMITSTALKNSLPQFLAICEDEPIFKKFLSDRIDIERAEGLRMVV